MKPMMLKKKLLTLVAAIMLATTASVAQAATYGVESYDPAGHSVWIPGIGQEHLHFTPDAVLEMDADSWRLTGTLISGTDGSLWELEAIFSHVLPAADYPDYRYSSVGKDWLFAEYLRGRLTKLSGDGAGVSYLMSRYIGDQDYWSQYGTGMNEKNGELGLSTWVNFTEYVNAEPGKTYRGDINVNLSSAVPEPSAALVFGAGSLIVGAVCRRGRRA